MKKEGSLLLSDYAAEIAATDVLNPNDFNRKRPTDTVLTVRV